MHPHLLLHPIFYVLRVGLCLALEKMRLNGGTEWISLTIEVQALLAVTYGSYLREIYLTMCSAAFILECDQGRREVGWLGSFLRNPSRPMHIKGSCRD